MIARRIDNTGLDYQCLDKCIVTVLLYVSFDQDSSTVEYRYDEFNSRVLFTVKHGYAIFSSQQQ